MAPDTDIITTPIPDFCRIAGLGRSKAYELIAAGTIDSVLIGGRRLIVMDSWRRLVAEALRSRRDPAGLDTAANGGAAR